MWVHQVSYWLPCNLTRRVSLLLETARASAEKHIVPTLHRATLTFSLANTTMTQHREYCFKPVAQRFYSVLPTHTFIGGSVGTAALCASA